MDKMHSKQKPRIFFVNANAFHFGLLNEKVERLKKMVF